MSTDGPAADATGTAAGRSGDQGPRVARLSRQAPASGETFHELAALGGARVEHIISSDTPDQALQLQDWDEWVLLVSGGAELEVSGRRVRLTAGTWIVLPAGTPHRVLTTQAGTHWIAVHAAPQPADQP